ncbi:MAG: cytochrome c oxidase assembly protein [Actinobacteria bacterium]|nr:cytochrome c oxidase assembly protein [Actinomycetota bacterium]
MTRRPSLFVVGTIVVVAAVLPPLDHASAERFSMHMVQHMIFVLIAAPLLAGSGVVAVRSRLLKSVVFVGLLHAAALWLWHLPVFYDAAMENDVLHVLEHASFLVTAVLFWNVVFDRNLERFTRVGLVFGTMLQSGALGVVIAFASAPLYGWHVENTPRLEPAGDGGTTVVLQDQQLAGAIMWIPPGVVYLVVIVVLLARALAAFDTAEQR